MYPLYTIGYERAAIGDFLATLTDASVAELIDVRERPLSRRPEYSRDALRKSVESTGIRYRNERDLGAPPAVRNAVKRDRDYDAFFRRYRAHLDEQDATLRRLAGELQALDGPAALMCYERDPAQCHRSVIAARIETLTGATTHHLDVNRPA